MTKQMERPALKSISAKVNEEDMIYFSLGIDKKEDFILPSERNSYLSDEKAVALVRAVHNGEKFIGQDFSGLNLKGADLSGGFFRECKFSKTVFYNTKMRNCQLQNVDFSGAYMEDCDFTGSKLQGASFAHAFVKDTSFSDKYLDDKAKKYISELEKLIHLIEQGKVDLRTLSKSDLLHLDIRRIDFTNIDLTDIDLSVFALDGVNLMGTYIDPKQVMSKEGLEKYYLDLKHMKAKKLAELEKELLKARESQLAKYGQNMLATKSFETYQNSDKKPRLRPAKKQIELAQMPPKAPTIVPTQPVVAPQKPLTQEPVTPTKTKQPEIEKLQTPQTSQVSKTNQPVDKSLLSDDNKIVLDASLLAQELLEKKTVVQKPQTPILKPQLPSEKTKETQSIEEVRRPPIPKMIIRGERNEYTERQEERARLAQEQLNIQSNQSSVQLSSSSIEPIEQKNETLKTQSDEKKIQVSLDQLSEILHTKETTLTGMMDSVFKEEKQEDEKDDEELDDTQEDEDLEEETKTKKVVFVSTNKDDDADTDDENGGVVIHQPLISDIKRIAQRGPRLKKTRLKVKG